MVAQHNCLDSKIAPADRGRGIAFGRVAEWFKAPVLKVERPWHIESRPVPLGAAFQRFSPPLHSV
jgi:hypothetical protein